MRKMTYEGYKKYRKMMRRVSVYGKILALFVVCLMPFFLLKATAAPDKTAGINMSVKSDSILQGEELPQYEVSVSVEGRLDMVLDKESGYTLGDLAEELKQESSYTIQCNADADIEGEYPIILSLNEEIKRQIETNYLSRLTVLLENGSLTVKNPVGEWDGSKFRKYDGTYVLSDFVVSRGNTYYFDAEGNKVTGWHNIAGAQYYFDKMGVLKKNCWQANGEFRSYLNEQGIAVTGWLTLDGEKYYFDKDGHMVTGECIMGVTVYNFAEDGKLVSERTTKIDPDRPMVALTFDDGPGERTGELLTQLEKFHAHATFFMVGKNVPSYPDAVKKMKEIGCELGNHSYDHADLGKADAETIKSQITGTNDAVKAITGQGATVMRPPYGSVSTLLKENAGMPLILWNIDTLDWKTRNAQATIDTVMEQVEDGDIILMHDIHTESVDAAMVLIPKLQEAGYQLVTVSEMAAAKGTTLVNGEKYTDF